MTGPVQAVHVDDIHADNLAPGSFQIRGSRFVSICPCGCGSRISLPINMTDGTHPSWEWNGRLDAPTLKPSIRDVGTCYFHGVLTDGVWTCVGDSGVKPA
jgi:hypothetical protein